MLNIFTVYTASNDVRLLFFFFFSWLTTMLEFDWCVFHVYLVRAGDLHVTGPPVPLG